jgi:hypothetical protein
LYLLEVFNGILALVESVLHHHEVEVVPCEQLEYLFSLLVGEAGDVEGGQVGGVEGQLVELLLGEGEDVGLYVELLAVVQFLLFALLHPVVDGADFGVALDDGHAQPVVERLEGGGVLDGAMGTFLAESTSLMGKRPPVRLRTSLSVT